MAAGSGTRGCDRKGGHRAPFLWGGVWGYAPPELIWNLEAQKCNIQHSGHKKKSFVSHNFYWSMNTVFDEADVLDSLSIIYL